jgi:hypothetical protein
MSHSASGFDSGVPDELAQRARLVDQFMKRDGLCRFLGYSSKRDVAGSGDCVAFQLLEQIDRQGDVLKVQFDIPAVAGRRCGARKFVSLTSADSKGVRGGPHLRARCRNSVRSNSPAPVPSICRVAPSIPGPEFGR